MARVRLKCTKINKEYEKNVFLNMNIIIPKQTISAVPQPSKTFFVSWSEKS